MPRLTTALTSTSTPSTIPSPSHGPLFIKTIFGTSVPGNDASGLPATSTSITNPMALALEDAGTLLVAGESFICVCLWNYSSVLDLCLLYA